MKRNRVTIVEPRGVSANVYDRYMSLPLLGPIYLGTILEAQGFDVRVINENLVNRDISLSEMDADFLLISALTCTVERGYDLALRFRRLNPRGKVIIGGPHVSFRQEEAARFADHVVVGEGEQVIADLLRYGSDDVVIPGVSTRDLDSIPIPNFRLLAGHERMTRYPLITSRGCPFDCEFCSVTKMFGRRYRFNSVERVLEELRIVGDVEVFFADDNFTANPRHTHELLDGMERTHVRPRQWSTQVRADVARDEDLVKRMRELGCTRLYVGFESVSQATLDAMNKKQDVEEVIHAIETFHKYGIRVHGMFILGNDGEDDSTVEETLKFIERHGIDSVQFMVITPFPGTATYRRLEQEGRLLHQVWSYYDAMHVVHRPVGQTPYHLQEKMIEAYGRFYAAPAAARQVVSGMAEGVQRLARSSIPYLLRPTRLNASIRLGGSMMVRKWRQVNQDYFAYLRQVSIPTSLADSPNLVVGEAGVAAT